MINALTIPPSPPPKKCDTVFSRAMMTIGRCFIIWFFFEMFFLNEGDIFYGYSNFQITAIQTFKTLAISFFTDAPFIIILFYGLFTLWLLIPIYLFRMLSI